MADINDPEAIKFVNEVIRPMAELRRAFDAKVDSLVNKWNGDTGKGGTFGALFTLNTDGDVLDGREVEGISRLTGNDVVLFFNILNAAKIESDKTGARVVIEKPCVRNLEIN